MAAGPARPERRRQTPLGLPHTAWSPYLDAHGTPTPASPRSFPSPRRSSHRHRDRTGRGGPSRGSPNSPPGTSPRHTGDVHRTRRAWGSRDGVPAAHPHAGPDPDERLPNILFVPEARESTPTAGSVNVFSPAADWGRRRALPRLLGLRRTYRELATDMGRGGREDLRRGRLPPTSRSGAPTRRGCGPGPAPREPRPSRPSRTPTRAPQRPSTARSPTRSGWRSTPAWRRGTCARSLPTPRCAQPPWRTGPHRVRRRSTATAGRPAGPDGQAESCRDALQENRVPHAYLVFKGRPRVGAESSPGPRRQLSSTAIARVPSPRRDPTAPPHRRIARAGVSPRQLAPSRHVASPRPAASCHSRKGPSAQPVRTCSVTDSSRSRVRPAAMPRLLPLCDKGLRTPLRDVEGGSRLHRPGRTRAGHGHRDIEAPPAEQQGQIMLQWKGRGPVLEQPSPSTSSPRFCALATTEAAPGTAPWRTLLCRRRSDRCPRGHGMARFEGELARAAHTPPTTPPTRRAPPLQRRGAAVVTPAAVGAREH